MERFELEQPLQEEIRGGVLGDGFMKLVQSVRRNGKTFRIALRPVEIGGEKRFQAEMTDEGRTQVKNFDANGIASGLEEIIAQKGARELHLMTAKGDLHVRVTKKGHVLVSRSAQMNRVAKVQPHDRVKNLPLNSFDSGAFLKAVGIADGEGKVRASMRGKYDQVNEFLKVVGETVPNAKSESPDSPASITVVDCGCGKAYLTFALWYYLTQTLGYANVRVIGVDRRDDVISSAEMTAGVLDLEGHVSFVKAELADIDLKSSFPDAAEAPLMVVSLHACDTATDEALAKAVEWKARWILSAPCCQHELQKSVGSEGNMNLPRAAFNAVMRHGILRERLCDILTDSFRATILRILGFKTQVMEFVSPDATARNIMLKAEFSVKRGQAQPVSEYLELRDFWGVVPWLETRLAKQLEAYIRKYE